MPIGRDIISFRGSDRSLSRSRLHDSFKRGTMMRTWFRWVVLVVFASLSLTSVAAQQKTDPSPKTAAAKTKSLKAPAAKPLAAKPPAKQSAEKQHRMVIQVDQNDPAVMNIRAQQRNKCNRILSRQRHRDQSRYGDLRPGSPHAARRYFAGEGPDQAIKGLWFPSKFSFPPATTPRKTWRKKRGSRSALYPKPSSSQQVSFT